MAVGDAFCMKFWVCIAACIGMLSILTGCDGAMRAATASSMPGPNFAGPVIAQPTYVPPPPLSTAQSNPPPGKIDVPRQSIPSAWIPSTSAPKRNWTWIVIHHSAGTQGGARSFDKYHREHNGWDSLGYHFVIGNGTETGDGLVEVGSRWPIQKHGAHAKTPDNQYNERGIGICLVGNFDVTRPTPRQMASLAKLVAFLADRYRISQTHIIGHMDTGKDTDCPGTHMDLAAVRAAVAKQRTSLVVEERLDFDRELIRTAAR